MLLGMRPSHRHGGIKEQTLLPLKTTRRIALIDPYGARSAIPDYGDVLRGPTYQHPSERPASVGGQTIVGGAPISVGVASPREFPIPGTGVSGVVPRVAVRQETVIPREIAGEPTSPLWSFPVPPPTYKETPVTVAPPLPRPPVSSSPIPSLGVGLPNFINQGRPPMDLGSIITGLGGAYINARYPVQQPMLQPAFMGLGGDSSGGLPGLDIISEAPVKGMCWNPAANCGQGKWQKRTRRRRKRLATQGDLKDLAALKGVLGGGKAFEVWIATHG